MQNHIVVFSDCTAAPPPWNLFSLFRVTSHKNILFFLNIISGLKSSFLSLIKCNNGWWLLEMLSVFLYSYCSDDQILNILIFFNILDRVSRPHFGALLERLRNLITTDSQRLLHTPSNCHHTSQCQGLVEKNLKSRLWFRSPP